MGFHRQVRKVRSHIRGVITRMSRDVVVQGDVWFSMIAWVRWRWSLRVSWPGCEVLVGYIEVVMGVGRCPVAVVSWGSLG